MVVGWWQKRDSGGGSGCDEKGDFVGDDDASRMGCCGEGNGSGESRKVLVTK